MRNLIYCLLFYTLPDTSIVTKDYQLYHKLIMDNSLPVQKSCIEYQKEKIYTIYFDTIDSLHLLKTSYYDNKIH